MWLTCWYLFTPDFPSAGFRHTNEQITRGENHLHFKQASFPHMIQKQRKSFFHLHTAVIQVLTAAAVQESCPLLSTPMHFITAVVT